MREILFRGKRVDNGEWVEGCYTLYPDGKSEILRKCDTSPDSDPMWRKVLISFVVNSTTICQYTGLTDKSGRKIFEGDIVKIGCREIEWIARVEFGNPNGKYDWGFQFVPITKCDANTDILLWVEMEETGAFCKVIGNIFDNPELLEGESNGRA